MSDKTIVTEESIAPEALLPHTEVIEGEIQSNTNIDSDIPTIPTITGNENENILVDVEKNVPTSTDTITVNSGENIESNNGIDSENNSGVIPENTSVIVNENNTSTEVDLAASENTKNIQGEGEDEYPSDEETNGSLPFVEIKHTRSGRGRKRKNVEEIHFRSTMPEKLRENASGLVKHGKGPVQLIRAMEALISAYYIEHGNTSESREYVRRICGVVAGDPEIVIRNPNKMLSQKIFEKNVSTKSLGKLKMGSPEWIYAYLAAEDSKNGVFVDPLIYSDMLVDQIKYLRIDQFTHLFLATQYQFHQFMTKEYGTENFLWNVVNHFQSRASNENGNA